MSDKKEKFSKNSSARPKPLKAPPFRIGPWRRAVQVGFLLTCVWIGYEFTLWVHQMQSGVATADTAELQLLIIIS